MDNICPSKVISKNRHPRPLNPIPLLLFGPTDRDNYLRRKTKKKVIEFVRRLFIEDEAEEVGERQEWKVEEEAGETFEEWAAAELVYEVDEEDDEEEDDEVDEKDDEEEDDEDDEEEDEEDEGEGDMGSVGLVGPGLNGMDQVNPTLKTGGGIFRGLDISQEKIESYEPFADICGDCLGSMDILEELLRSDLQNGK